MKAGHRCFRFVIIGELDESEPARLAADLVLGDMDIGRCSKFCGEVVELSIRGLFGQIAYIKFHKPSLKCLAKKVGSGRLT